VRLPSASSFWSRLLEFPAVVQFEFQPLVSQFKKLKLNNHRISYDVTKFLDKNVTWELLSQRCAHAMFVKESPEWRNWQTRWTQNPVVLSTVWVRPPPPGPSFVRMS
jgi:hypothetical protein